MKLRWRISLLVGEIIIGGFFIFNIPFFISNISHITQGCEGIENFYTGNNFWYDALMISNHAKVPEKDNAVVYGKSPLALWNNETVDCEAISNAMMCMSQLYNVTCEFYMYAEYHNKNMTLEKSHLGIECLNDNGLWIMMF